MSAFPGRIFDGEGVPMDGRKADLTQNELDACPHRSLVQIPMDEPTALRPVAWVWLMDNDARFAAIPQAIVSSAVTLMLDGHGVLVLARLPEVGVEIRDGLLQALELAQAPDEAGGHA